MSPGVSINLIGAYVITYVGLTYKGQVFVFATQVAYAVDFPKKKIRPLRSLLVHERLSVERVCSYFWSGRDGGS